jgi:hypothetical protein
MPESMVVRECYDVPATSPFLVRTAEDDEGYDQTLKGEEKRFKVERNGDHLMCLFQCDLCHFRNIQERDPGFGNRIDILLLQCIRRASLDAFWSREPSTARANALGARRLEEIGDTLGMRSVCPPPWVPIWKKIRLGWVWLFASCCKLSTREKPRSISNSQLRGVLEAFTQTSTMLCPSTKLGCP